MAEILQSEKIEKLIGILQDPTTVIDYMDDGTVRLLYHGMEIDPQIPPDDVLDLLDWHVGDE